MAFESVSRFSDFQAEYEGSIPFTRSNVFSHFSTRSNLAGSGSSLPAPLVAHDFPNSPGFIDCAQEASRSLFHPQLDSVFWSIASTERGEIPSSTNPGISGDDTVSICINST